jgi:solute carrier family 25 protein 16
MAFHTRPQSKQLTPAPPSFMHAYKHIYNEYTFPVQPSTSQHTRPLLERFPILKFYRGFTVTVAGMVPYAGVSFLSWGYLRSRILPPPKVGGYNPPTPIADFVIGAVSGAIAQTASYPFEVVRRRMQVGGITSPDRWLRFGETVNGVWKTGGWRGFYVGLGIGYLKVVPMTAVSFAVWQSCKRLLNL